jgi:hypothetical protein
MVDLGAGGDPDTRHVTSEESAIRAALIQEPNHIL